MGTNQLDAYEGITVLSRRGWSFFARFAQVSLRVRNTAYVGIRGAKNISRLILIAARLQLFVVLQVGLFFVWQVACSLLKRKRPDNQ